MEGIINLNEKNLHLLPKEVSVPGYNRSKIKAGIAHIGIGAFHRSHEAPYTDQILHYPCNADWGICGIALLEADKKIYNVLAEQDGLYTLMIAKSDGTLTVRVIGSIIEFLFAPENPDTVIEKLASPNIRIVSLTITEGGYNFNASTGEFQMKEPLIQWDLNNPSNPKTVFGYITQALKRRKERGTAGLTFQSCDNIQKNGDMLKKMLLTFIEEAEPGLSGWIQEQVTFPNSMVDRITPAITSSDIENLQSLFSIKDSWPVVCEPFIQWVVEDNYSNGRPPWQSVGVQFIHDVSPFEKMKIRLLNAGHSLLGLAGALCGYTYIHDVVHDQLFANFLREFMENEVTPVLDQVPGMDLNAYKKSLFERFGNPRIKDRVERICLQCSAKIPKFLLPTIREQLKAGGPLDCAALVVATWCRYSEGFDESGNKYSIEDEMKEILQENALRSHQDPVSFLRIEPVFGDLINSKRFTDAYVKALQCLYQLGIIECLKKRISPNVFS